MLALKFSYYLAPFFFFILLLSRFPYCIQNPTKSKPIFTFFFIFFIILSRNIYKFFYFRLPLAFLSVLVYDRVRNYMFTKEEKMPREVQNKNEKTVKEELPSTDKKQAVSKKASTKKTASKTATKSTEKKATTKKKTTTKKVATVKKDTKSSTAKKSTKSTTTRKSTKTALVSKKAVPVSFLPEYYDLPYRYNQTIVRILAQTPTTLFVYWDISDADREKYTLTYGEHFFETTVPVLIVHNKTKEYFFEVEIHDFANSWYLHVGDSDCVYEIELGRRPRSQDTTLPNHFLHIAYSNDLETPNDHILANTIGNTIIFKDTKQNHVFAESIVSLRLMEHLGPIYPIYDIYEKLYKEELQGMKLRESNPSSGSFLS